MRKSYGLIALILVALTTLAAALSIASAQNDECHTDITLDYEAELPLGADCPSSLEFSEGFSHYYTFHLAENEGVEISMQSADFDTILILRHGERTSGEPVEVEDDIDETNSDSLMVLDSSYGDATYTLEAGSYGVGQTGLYYIQFLFEVPEQQPRPTEPPPVGGDDLKITVNWGSACVLHPESGTVSCQPVPGIEELPIGPDPSEFYVDVDSAANHTCGVTIEGYVDCWRQ